MIFINPSVPITKFPCSNLKPLLANASEKTAHLHVKSHDVFLGPNSVKKYFSLNLVQSSGI